MLLLTIFLPVIGAAMAGFTGRKLGTNGSSLMVILCLMLSLIITLTQLSLVNENAIYFTLYTWASIGTFYVPIEFLFDNVTFVMLIVVLSISLIVHIYSTQYLATDPHLPRFLAYLSFFTFFMLILVSSENLIQLFLGWEGVGICSYLLINFWFTRIQANKSALKAVFVNKVGDISLLFALSLTYFLTGSTSFSVVLSTIPYLTHLTITICGITVGTLDAVAFFFLLGAIGKSAQIGLHVWLPDAMEGPTPVSALLHAATMVTAGVFLLIRLSFIFEHTPTILLITLFFGALTAFFAATTGLLQNDLKRIIAFSTCSQLGYMFVACSMSQYSLGLFHLFNHAFFKALLFLAAGSVIHALADEQDIRKMGGLFNYLPLTFTFFFIASLSLMGIPFLSGFYSKDIIIEHTLFNHSFAYITLVSAAAFTAAYSTRLLYYVFLARPNFFRTNLGRIFEANLITQLPLVFLTLCSIFSGYFYTDLFVGFGSTFFSHSIAPLSSIMIELEFLSPVLKQLPFILSFGSVLTTYFLLTSIHHINYLRSWFLYQCFCFLNHKWFFDKTYNTLILYTIKQTYYWFFSFLDKGLIEVLGPSGIYKVVLQMAIGLRNQQTGQLSSYMWTISAGIIFGLIGLNLFF